MDSINLSRIHSFQPREREREREGEREREREREEREREREREGEIERERVLFEFPSSLQTFFHHVRVRFNLFKSKMSKGPICFMDFRLHTACTHSIMRILNNSIFQKFSGYSRFSPMYHDFIVKFPPLSVTTSILKNNCYYDN